MKNISCKATECAKVCIILLASFLTFYPHNSVSQTQDLKFGHLNVEQGLSYNFVKCIIQDKRGFMWIGTQDGLNKYDGYRFKVYKFASNDIRCIYEDKSGFMWLGTGSGFVLFDPLKERVELVNTWVNTNVNSIVEDKQGFFWLATSEGVRKYDRERDKVTKPEYMSKDSISLLNDYINQIFLDREGMLWIGGLRGLFYTINSDGKISSHSTGLLDGILTFCEDELGQIWIGSTGEGFYNYDKTTGTLKNQVFGNPQRTHPDFTVNTMINADNNDLFIGAANADYKGLYGLSKADGSLYQFSHNTLNPQSLIWDFVTALAKDSSGTLWVGTSRGLDFTFPGKGRFQLYRCKPYELYTRFDNLYAICEDHEKIMWLGTDAEGLLRLDRSKNSYESFKYDTAVQGNQCFSIAEDSDNKNLLWVGTFTKGLKTFDKTRKKFSSVFGNSDTSAYRQISSISQDTSGYLWVGSYGGGLVRYGKRSGEMLIYRHSENDVNSLSSDKVSVVYRNRGRLLWVGTSDGINDPRGQIGNGLNSFNEVAQTFTRYLNDPNDKRSISNNNIRCIAEDKEGNLWIGTSSGLNKYDASTNSFQSCFEQDGLPSSMISSILPDSENRLWLATFKGMCVFDPKSKTVRKFDKGSGLQDVRFNPNAWFISKSGEFFAGGINGFNSFYPQSIKENSYKPPVVITKFQVLDREVNADSEIYFGKPVTLDYSQNVFGFEFSALNYLEPSKNLYAYKMEGFDKDWVFTNADRRSVNYTNLDPGSYTFRVKGSNNDGVWNDEGVSVKIIITPPFWKTWWFTMLSVLLIAAVFGGSVRYVTIQRYKRRLALEKERARISKDMHDEVGSSLTKIAILSELAKQKVVDPKVKGEVEKISESASKVVDNISEIIWAINPKNDTLDNLLAYIREYASETLEMKNINYSVKLPENIPAVHLSAEVRRNIFLVVKEALNNILKYAEATKVDINTISNNGQLQLTISDNGKGFDINNTRKFGNGLINMRKRIDDIKGVFNIKSSESGTSVLISLELKHI